MLQYCSDRSSAISGDSSSSGSQKAHCLHMRSSSQQVADGASNGLHSGSGRNKVYVHHSAQQLAAASEFQQSTAGIRSAAGALVSAAATRQRQQHNSSRGSTSSTCTEMTAAAAGANGAQHSVNHTAAQRQHVQPRLAQKSQAAASVAASVMCAAGGAVIGAQQRAQTRQQQHQKKRQQTQGRKPSQQLQQKQAPQQPHVSLIASSGAQQPAAAAVAAPSKAGYAAGPPAQRVPKGLQRSKPPSSSRAGARSAAVALQQSAAGQLRAPPSEPTQRQPATALKHSRQAMPQRRQVLESQRAALLQAIRLLPPPPDAAEAKHMQAAFQYVLFADHAAYVMGLLQPCAAAKLGCLMRLAADDLQTILAQPQPLELLDALWEQHRQQG